MKGKTSKANKYLQNFKLVNQQTFNVAIQGVEVTSELQLISQSDSTTSLASTQTRFSPTDEEV